MANQIVVSAGAKVRNLQDVIIGTSGVLTSLGFDVANGVPRLDVNGKILVSQLPNSVMEYKGTWNANTNTPTLANGTGNQGDVYLCNVAGTVNFGAGPIAFVVGDQVIYSGSIWQRASGATGTVTSVAITESGDSLNITGSPITTSGTINIGFNGTNLQYVNGAGNLTTFPTLITSIGLSMPSAFSVANSPLTANGTIAVTGAGVASQYIRGDGTLADFPSSGGGGSSVSYYLNGGTSQGTIGGTTYYEMSKTAVIGTGVDFTKTGDGFIVAFLTDANDPAQLNIPAGNWNYEIYASMSSNGGTPEMYAELYVYDGTTFTLISTSSNEIIYDGTALNLYTFAMAVPATSLTLTDRLAVKLYATNSGGKTTTIHTQDSHLCQIITTFSTGITALNGLTAQVQYFQVGTSGTDFNISSTTATHTFNIPDASATARGLITTGTQTITGAKTFSNVSTFNLGLTLQDGYYPTPATGYVGLSSNGSGITILTKSGITVYNNNLQFSNASNSYYFPNATGTIALTSDIPSITGLVPYTGATANVDLGTNSITLFNITSNNVLIVKNTGSVTGTNGFSSFSGNIANNGFTFAPNNSSYHRFIVPTSSNYDYTLPSASGTLALVGGSGVGTVTSVAALTIGTTGTDLSSSVANSTTTPVITLNVPTASATNRGALSSADWTTFNNKQSALTNPVTGTGTTNYLPKFTGTSTIGNSAITDDGTTVTLVSRALSGTSASFSGSLGVNSTIRSTGQTDPTSGVGMELFYRSADTSSYIQSYDRTNSAWKDVRIYGSTLYFGSQGSNNLTIASTGAATFSGNVGLGAISSYAKFNISTGDDNQMSIGTTSTGQTAAIFFADGPSTSSVGFKWEIGKNTANDFFIYSYGIASFPFKINYSTGAATISATSAVALTANGGNSSDGTVAKFSRGGAEKNFYISCTNNQYVNLGTEGDFRFKTGVTVDQPYATGIDAMVIKSTGDVGIGTLTPTSLSTYRYLSINASAGGILDLKRSETSQLQISAEGSGNYISGITNTSLYFYTNNGLRLTIANSGAATFTGSVTATSFFESSDSRLKTLIQDNYQTKGIASITPKLYTKNGKVELGYYAQDFVGILDSAVSKGSDDMLSLSYREVLVAKVYALEQEIKELKGKMN